ncbi:energy-coupling factor transport system ATP-binding protein [Seinonella peptonophila]|uniref:Energy-coupling factor transport system ATP-binding protein n=1 Tax=Seinonella peptonophila TaxID=112248 RepID=A0A1M5B9R6_9BACL|nr:ABC transporter ATP-binding protein [Seinonella peptonophila]SHF39170.1 energy-coupling factor transport system ATP-binding protein [Seinonella peptonophila]
MDYLIEIQQVTYQYPTGEKPVLQDVSFQIKKGEFCAIIGPNGSGKTTLCNAIRGFIPHFYKGELHGDVRINGKSIKDQTVGELSLQVGFVFQNPFSQISGVSETVFEEIRFGLENLGIDTVVAEKRVDEVMKLTKITHLQDRNPFELSGGQLQRVALASIIVMEPDILVIDEPTSQLDPEGTEEVFEIIRLMKEKQKTIILVEHKMELIAEYADHIILIDDGKVILNGNNEEILTNEKVLEHNTLLPQYAMLGLELRKHGVNLDRIPVTEKQAKEELTKWFAQEGQIYV